MEKQTKHRLIGVGIIIALVVISLPLFQSNKEMNTEMALVKTPPFPNQPTELAYNNNNLIPPVMDDVSIAVKNATKPPPDKQENKEVTLNKDKERLQLTKDTTVAWVIQIGNFKNKSNAVRLFNRLRNNGYTAFMQQTTTSGSTKVFVGPEHQKTSASALANRLKSEMQIKGMVIRYKPLTS